jgi:putative ABC transport system permease protein
MPDRQLTADLQHISSIHLRSDRAFEMQPGGNRATVLLFAGIAVFILILACVNFINLATARSIDRRAEVGVRKALGARRRDLVYQFLGEALLVSAAALGLAVVCAYAALPAFNAMAGTSLSLAGNASVAEGIVGAAIVLAALTALAGGYPAMALSRFGPRRALAGNATGAPRESRSWLRSGLVVFQFATAVVLVIGTAMIYQQVDFMQTRDLGYDKERIVTLPNRDHGLTENIPRTERELSQSPAVQRVAAVGALPGDRMPQRIVRRPDTRQATTAAMLHADTAFAETMGLEITAGRWLQALWATERELEVVLNETAVQRLGFASPDAALGKPLHRMHPEAPDSVQARGRVVGVVKDFHWSALRDRVPPMVLVPAESKFDLEHYVARLTPGQTAEGVDALTTTWNEISNYPATFRYSFLSDDWSALYRGEQRLQRIVGAFAGLAILIACLGLFGLAAYTARRRTKEIGIRKALGATIASIVGLLSKDFLVLVAVACGLALPIAFLSAQWWLSDYAYRVSLSPMIFMSVVIGTVLLALLAVSQQAWRAARVDPAEVLRSE